MFTLRKPAALATSATVLLLLATVTVPAFAQEEAGLCRVMDIGEMAEMTGQQYEGSPFWDLAEDCKYLATSDPDGFHYVRLHLDGLYAYEQYREGSLDPVDLEVGGLSAFAVSDDDPRGWLNTQVSVDLGDVTLRATVIADEGADAVQLDNTVRLAETAVANLDYAAAPEPDVPDTAPVTTSEVPPIALPEVDGLDWGGEFEVYGEAAADSGLSLPFIDVLLDAAGADMSRFGIHGANARDVAAGDDGGSYVAMRVAGVDAESLERAALAWLAALFDMSEAPVGSVSIGGRDVLLVRPPDEQPPAYLYIAGDVAHLISASEDAAAKIVAALP